MENSVVIGINFISSTDTNGGCVMNSKSNIKEFIIYDNTDWISIWIIGNLNDR